MQNRQTTASSASDIDRAAAARAAATRCRSAHVVRAVLSLVVFPALGWCIAIGFGKPMATLAMGVALLALPVCIGFTIAAVVAGERERRALLEVDRVLSTHDLAALAEAPIELPQIIGEYTLHREHDGIRGTLVGSRFGVIVRKLGLLLGAALVVMITIGIAYAVPRTAWWLARRIEGPGVYVVWFLGAAAALPFLQAALRAHALAWTFTPAGVRVRRVVAIFGVSRRTIPTSQIDGLLVLDGGVEVRPRNRTPIRLLNPAPLKLDPHAGASGLYEKRIAQHRAMTDWQAHRLARLLNQIRSTPV